MRYDIVAPWRDASPEAGGAHTARTRRFYLPGAGITQVPPVDALAAGLIPVGTYTYPYKPTQQQVITARRYSIGDSYTRRMLDVLVDGAVGQDGIKFVFRDPRAQEAWDNWSWNRSSPHERIDDLQRDMVKGVIRDGEAFYEVLADMDGYYVNEIDPLQVEMEDGGQVQRLWGVLCFTTSRTWIRMPSLRWLRSGLYICTGTTSLSSVGGRRGCPLPSLS